MVDTFGCGDYLPGAPKIIPEGRGGSGNGPGGGPTNIIVPPAGPGPPIPRIDIPTIPRGGLGQYWRCYEQEPYSVCIGNQTVKALQIDRECQECSEEDIIREEQLPRNERECVFSPVGACFRACRSQVGRCGPPGGVVTKYKCETTYIYCPPGQITVTTGEKRECVKCDGNEAPAVICDLKPQCEKRCTGTTLPKCKDPGPISVLRGDPDDRGMSRGGNSPGGRVGNFAAPSTVYDVLSKTRQISTLKKPEIVNLDDEKRKSLGEGAENRGSEYYNRSMYSLEYNLGVNSRKNLNVEMVSNGIRNDVFNTIVSEPVHWALQYISTSGTWDEDTFEDMTLENIAISLQPHLLQAFNSIRRVGGNKVDVSLFLSTVKRLLLSNRIGEFAPEFFTELAESQKDSTIVNYSHTTDRDVRDQAALGIITLNPSQGDPEKNPDYQKPFFRKSRFLNTDINLGMPILICDDDPIVANLANEGLQLLRLKNSNNANEQESSLMELAEGGGYYMSATLYDDTGSESARVVVDATSDIDDAIVVNPESRTKALNIVGEDSSITFIAESTYARSEFGDNYDTTTTLTPMYFVLDLSTVGKVGTTNPLILQTCATYKVLTDADDISLHARSNGFKVVAGAVDFNDPFLVYANNAGSMTLRCNDITFRNFQPAKGNVGNLLLPRTIPFGIVLHPGRGSHHNPFGGISNLIEWETSVKRSASFIPHLDTPESENYKTVLNYDYTYNLEGVFKTGLAEPTDADNIVFSYDSTAAIFTDNYVEDGKKSSTVPTRTRSAIGNLVHRVIDNVILARYEIINSNITWYDVWRRLSSDEFFDIMDTKVGANFTDWLSNGGRGITISSVLNSRSALVTTGLGDVKDEDITDTIFINDGDRQYKVPLK